jgi:hypothetical protein
MCITTNVAFQTDGDISDLADLKFHFLYTAYFL